MGGESTRGEKNRAKATDTEEEGKWVVILYDKDEDEDEGDLRHGDAAKTETVATPAGEREGREREGSVSTAPSPFSTNFFSGLFLHRPALEKSPIISLNPIIF